MNILNYSFYLQGVKNFSKFFDELPGKKKQFKQYNMLIKLYNRLNKFFEKFSQLGFNWLQNIYSLFK